MQGPGGKTTGPLEVTGKAHGVGLGAGLGAGLGVGAAVAMATWVGVGAGVGDGVDAVHALVNSPATTMMDAARHRP